MKKSEEERDFEKGLFKAAFPCCGYEQYFFVSDVDTFFGCPFCHEFAWLRYKYLDRERGIVYGLQLVQEP